MWPGLSPTEVPWEMALPVRMDLYCGVARAASKGVGAGGQRRRLRCIPTSLSASWAALESQRPQVPEDDVKAKSLVESKEA